MAQTETGEGARDTADKASSGDVAAWVKGLARFGYAAKGVVYAIIGVLAAQAAFRGGSSGQTTGQSGALQTIVNQPFGRILLGLVAVGLVGYAIWRLVQAIMDPEQEGTDGEGIVKRIGYAISGLVYLGLAFTSFQIIRGTGGGGGGSTQDFTARLMSQPFGQWLVGIVGVIIISIGFFQLYKGFAAKFRDDLKLSEMGDAEETWATRAGRIGLAARGVVYGVIGGLLIQAAVQANPQQAGGLGEALSTLARQPYGPWILGLVALGLVAYGAYAALVLARFRKIEVR